MRKTRRQFTSAYAALAAVTTTSLGLLACALDANPASPEHADKRGAALELSFSPTPINPNPPVSTNPNPTLPLNQSFAAATVWAPNWGTNEGWGAEEPRLLADVTGDRRADIIGFGYDYVWLGISNGSSFTSVQSVENFTINSGWTVEKDIRTTADINGDGIQDIVGFGDAGVWTSLGSRTGLGPAVFVLADFGYNQGWRIENHVRTLADINGDGKMDIVGFGDAGVYVAIANGYGGFGGTIFALADLGFQSPNGWNPASSVRLLSDVNGDGKADIVGFGWDGVYVAISNGLGLFGPAGKVLPDFGLSEGWSSADVRTLADIDHDGHKDIVGFGPAGVYTARCNGLGFDPAKTPLPYMGTAQDWSSATDIRAVADLNDDGYPDLFGIHGDSVYRVIGGPAGFGELRPMMRDFAVSEGYTFATGPRLLGDVDANGTIDLLGISDQNARVSLSTSVPPYNAPPGITDLALISVATTSLSIAWDEVFTGTPNDATEFLIKSIAPDGSIVNTVVATAPHAETSPTAFPFAVTLNGLATNTTYDISVFALNLWGTSASTTSQSLTATTGLMRPVTRLLP